MIGMDMFYQDGVLNIFSDASIRKKGKDDFCGCYGVVAVCKDTIVDSIYRVATETTNNNSEIKGVRGAISLAIKYMYSYKTINIFSDSQISIFGLRDRIYNWSWNPNTGNLYGSENKLIKNQEIFVECYNMIKWSGVKVNLYHQNGHIGAKYNDILKAAHTFSASNGFRDKIDLNLIRYISKYNNIVDQESRSILYQTDIYKVNYQDPVSFRCLEKIKK